MNLTPDPSPLRERGAFPAIIAFVTSVLFLARPAVAQQATVSPFLNRALTTDTTAIVWVFGREQTDLSALGRAVVDAGGRVRRESAWLRAVSAEITSAGLRTLRSRPDVRHLQPVARFAGPAPDPGVAASPAVIPQNAPPTLAEYGASAMPFRVMNMFPLANLGVRGQGVKVAMFDTGFETQRSVFTGTTILAQRDFVFNDAVVRNQAGDVSSAHDHGTATWSLLAANQPGSMIGIAPDAQYILAKTEDVRSETRVEEDNWVAAMEWADSLGADVISSSLGYTAFNGGFAYTPAQLNGDVAVTTLAADIAAQRGIIVVISMGNDGPGAQTISTPADADSIISVGAVDSLGNLASFSSRGPTADGRTKPDVMGPGVAVFSATPSGFSRISGTSLSTPIVAGAAVLIKQMHPSFGPIDVRDALRQSANNSRNPDSGRGWGIPDVGVAATFPRGIVLTAPADTSLATPRPRFAWNAIDVPTLALPVRYTLMLSRDTGFTNLLLDTTLTGTEVVVPQALTPGSRFYARLTARAADSVTLRVQPSARYTITGAGEPPPPLTLLYQNFPNPFPARVTGISTTCIWFDLATSGTVRLDVLDIRGHLVRNLVPGTQFSDDLPAGRYGRLGAGATNGCGPELAWDGRDERGSPAPQGVYLIKLATPDGTFFKRIVYLGQP